MDTPGRPATTPIYTGLFLVSLATLMYEILLTRIFSVTMWYHFAFLAISIALFGMTAGAIIVYVAPRAFAGSDVARHLATHASLFAVTALASFGAYLCIPIGGGRAFLLSLAATYVVVSVPFVFSGIVMALALTRFPAQVGRLYAADLSGAACGCLLLLVLLGPTDGPGAVMAAALAAGLGAVAFARASESKGLRNTAAWLCAVVAVAATAQTLGAAQQHPLVHLIWVKGKRETRPMYEAWNSFSRIAVTAASSDPFLYGFSPLVPRQGVQQLALTIDASALTVLTNPAGGPRALQYLKYDPTNVAHYLRQGRVLVIGAGGGRDVLSALVFGQPSVVAVEINRAILDALNGVFGDFTGHLDRNRRVIFVNDEARSYVARQPAQFDIIQISFIDTWAATAAGAFALTENGLYTTEAWQLFLHRLTPRGVLSVSWWYVPPAPVEIYRLVSLAVAALTRDGVPDPRSHLLLVRDLPSVGALAHFQAGTPVGVGTLLVGRAPFSPGDVRTVEAVARLAGFEIALSPTTSLDPILARLGSGTDARFLDALPANVAAPTDDSPYFFNTIRLHDFFHQQAWAGPLDQLPAALVLGVLLVLVVGLTLTCIIVPLALSGGGHAVRGSGALLTFFTTIGLGFMLVEISQLERLMIFLGHPAYALSVVLFTLLLSTGVGSALTPRLERFEAGPTMTRLLLLFGGLLAFGIVTPYLITIFRAAVTPVRIAIAAGMLVPLGIGLGMAFPLGMHAAAARGASMLTPWLWGVNGAASVCASVLGVAIALAVGISAAYWTGVAAYAVALAALARSVRDAHAPATLGAMSSSRSESPA